MTREETRAYNRNYYIENREKIKRQVRKYAEMNPGKARATSAAGRKRRGAEYHKNYLAQYYKLQGKVERCRERARDWAKANPERYRLNQSKHQFKRAALERGAESGDRKSYLKFIEIVKLAGSLPCYWCGKRTTKKNRHIDHIFPLSKGGKDDVLNLCCSCAKCNQIKNAKPPEQFSGQFVIDFIGGVA